MADHQTTADQFIVQDLHEFWPDGFDVGDVADMCERAAHEIERLRAENERLKTAGPQGKEVW